MGPRVWHATNPTPPDHKALVSNLHLVTICLIGSPGCTSYSRPRVNSCYTQCCFITCYFHYRSCSLVDQHKVKGHNNGRKGNLYFNEFLVAITNYMNDEDDENNFQ
ncbi:hypothetical protein BLOT_006350 [Blomia tropicalis]|nr:hypothetical protein BLOT_006350 [Blomia tropicalis]